MPVPLFTIKLDCMPYDQLRLLDAWEAWDVPLEQQREWVIQLFGNQYVHDMEEFLSNQAISTQKEGHPNSPHPSDSPLDSLPEDSPGTQ
ncbi:hypothetical protein [Candidatus Nitronereus thalassa]|uniref:Uncharacterized protein n=1 Tax=Candidatus Nitronereus thalassa TaxID=3020898 RepID=A0ABU3K6Y0_9BACT|nr:hypothetical protein [Candidatus Nitronereus thalassa]MDT7042194.1 hypothetical protein [Candidatus Nitronereus thalassa]